MNEINDAIRQSQGIINPFESINNIERILFITYQGKDYIYFRYTYKKIKTKFNKTFNL